MSDELLIDISSYLYIYLGFFLGFIGSTGNILTISTFLFAKKYRHLASSIFLAGSALGEELLLVSSAFPDALTRLLGYDFYSVSSDMCKSTSFIYFAGALIAIASMYLAAMERYFKTSRSAIRREWMTGSRGRLLSLLTLAISLCVSIPYAIYRDIGSDSHVCEYTNSTFKRATSLVYAIIGVSLPILLWGTFGFLTWRNLKASSQHTNSTHNQLHHQVVRMILIQTSLVVFSVLPGSILQGYFLIAGKGTYGTTAVDTLLVCIFQLLLNLHSCTSFYVYLAVSPTFRRRAKAILCLRCSRSTRVMPFSQQTNTIGMQTLVVYNQ